MARLTANVTQLWRCLTSGTVGGHKWLCCGMPRVHKQNRRMTAKKHSKTDKRLTPTSSTHRTGIHIRVPQMPQICVIDLKMRQANQSPARTRAMARSCWPKSRPQVQRVNSFSFRGQRCVIDECCIFWTQRDVACRWLPPLCGINETLAICLTDRPTTRPSASCPLHSMTFQRFNMLCSTANCQSQTFVHLHKSLRSLNFIEIVTHGLDAWLLADSCLSLLLDAAKSKS